MDWKVTWWFALAAGAPCAACTSSKGTESTDGGPGVADSSTDSSEAGRSAEGGTTEGGGGDEAGQSCEAGASACGASCFDLSTDPSHCGSCSSACSAGLDCDEAQCCTRPLGQGVCDVAPPCGCSASENCVRIDAGPEECAPNGSVGQLGNCLTQTDCQHGLSCADGVCDPPCAAGIPCELNYVCFQQVETTQGGQDIPLGYAVCEPHCNPVFPTQADSSHVACGADQQCYTVFIGSWLTACASSTGSTGQGAACAYATDCSPGYFCISGGSNPNTCQRYCRVGLSDCTTGSCVEFGSPVYDTNGSYNQELGFCQ